MNNKNAKSIKNLNNNSFERTIKKSNPGITGILSLTNKSLKTRLNKRNNLKIPDKLQKQKQNKEKVKERFIEKYKLLLENFIETELSEGYGYNNLNNDVIEFLLNDYGINLTDDELEKIFEKLYKKKTIVGNNQLLKNIKLETQYEIMENIAEGLFYKILSGALDPNNSLDEALKNYNLI